MLWHYKKLSHNSSKVEYHQVDLFSREPKEKYDLVFFSFWLLHVPPTLIDEFLTNVYKAVDVGGKVFIIDSRFEPTSTAINHSLQNDGNIYKTRKLNDGREFNIIKIFYELNLLEEMLTQYYLDKRKLEPR